MSNLPIRAILDRSAIRSYGLGHVHVGELITEIDDERAVIGVPVAALAAAQHDVDDNEVAKARLKVLVHLPGTITLDVNARAVFAMAGVMRAAGGDLARSQAVWSAVRHAAVFLTTEPGEAKGLVPPDRIIAIPAADA